MRRLWAVVLGLPLLCACSLVTATDDDPTEPQPSPSTADRYINLNIVVSSGNEGTMRSPNGGEDGDGREAGLKRENEVVGVTLMLYRDDDGINTDGDTRFDLVRYYSVTERIENNSTNSEIEVSYTTGDQPLQEPKLDLSKTYHAIVVANRNLEDQAGKTVKEVRELTEPKIFNIGDGIGVDAQGFVMASENDAIIDFSDPQNRRVEGNNIYFTFDGIRIERLAARVDFWTKKATYSDVTYPDTPGYVYDVNDSKDQFVLTAITPFNLYNDGEYYIKRLNDGGAISYLAPEQSITDSYQNYVIDPKTGYKNDENATGTTFYDNPLKGLSDLSNSGYRKTTKMLHDNMTANEGINSQKATFTDDGGKDNFILCYPKENTLMLNSPLYYYATGLAIEGYYYKKGETTGTPYIYYGFLRHQGESSSEFYPIKAWEDLKPDDVGSQSTAMNFGVVRNNIYRISIESISEKGKEEDPKITLKIEVKNWDMFKHETIFM